MINTNSIASSYSPPIKIVIKYMGTAVLAFVLLTFLQLLEYETITGHHFQPKILALTHIATLGWITMIIFGALFQLVPVVLEVKLFSEVLAEIQYWIYLIGAAGLVYGFWVFDSKNFIMPSAIVLNAAMLIFAFNMIMTFIRVKKWNITGYYLAAAVFYLIVTAVAGLLLSINLYTPYIKINHLQYLNLHAHIAFVGWVSFVVMGVTYKLIPMFTLSHKYSTKSALGAFVLINTGLLGISTAMHYENTTIFFYFFVILIAVGIFLFLYQVYMIFKNRVRRKLDVGLELSVAAFIFFGISTLTGLITGVGNLSDVRNLSLIYGYLIVFGYLSMLIIGQLHKILPFLRWYHKYSSKAGKENVPMLKDMYSEKVGYSILYLMLSGMAVLTISFILHIQIGVLIAFILFFTASILFMINMITVLRR
ncbi:MAG: cbb3-type cytochrome c oxidase subunit I [Melioribacteraceae bacterium]|nr:cbb3-type cytochrome c oxidase subunit I [Melioribacteraceae bacterium]